MSLLYVFLDRFSVILWTIQNNGGKNNGNYRILRYYDQLLYGFGLGGKL